MRDAFCARVKIVFAHAFFCTRSDTRARLSITSNSSMPATIAATKTCDTPSDTEGRAAGHETAIDVARCRREADRGDKRDQPRTPSPPVQPAPQRVPTPISSPPAMPLMPAMRPLNSTRMLAAAPISAPPASAVQGV
jgi:hypothetical protein